MTPKTKDNLAAAAVYLLMVGLAVFCIGVLWSSPGDPRPAGTERGTQCHLHRTRC